MDFAPLIFFAFIFWAGLTIGCIGLLLLHHTMRPQWSLSILRLIESGAKTWPLPFVMFLVVWALHDKLYPWADKAIVAGDKVLQLKVWYLNSSGFLIRGIVGFAIMAAFAHVLMASTKRQEKSGDLNEEKWRSSVAAVGIVFFMLINTMLVTDWVMSLDKHWFSTIYGAWFVVGDLLMTISAASIWMCMRAKKAPYTSVVNPKLTKDLGNMLLMLTMVWAYFTFSQYLIIWSGNLPEETGYFYHRLQGMWSLLGTIVVVGQFFIPFLMLLSGNTKRTPQLLLTTACWIFCVRFLDLYWNVVPFFVKDTAKQDPISTVGPFLIAWAIVGLVWFGLFEMFRRQNTPLATYDPRIPATAEAPQHA